MVGRDTKLPAGTVVAAVGRDHGVKLHLQTKLLPQDLDGWCPGVREKLRPATFLVGAGTENWAGSYLLL